MPGCPTSVSCAHKSCVWHSVCARLSSTWVGYFYFLFFIVTRKDVPQILTNEQNTFAWNIQHIAFNIHD